MILFLICIGQYVYCFLGSGDDLLDMPVDLTAMLGFMRRQSRESVKQSSDGFGSLRIGLVPKFPRVQRQTDFEPTWFLDI